MVIRKSTFLKDTLLYQTFELIRGDFWRASLSISHKPNIPTIFVRQIYFESIDQRYPVYGNIDCSLYIIRF